MSLCKETGQYRKGKLGSKPLNSKVLYGNLGLQKSPVCPISIVGFMSVLSWMFSYICHSERSEESPNRRNFSHSKKVGRELIITKPTRTKTDFVYS